MNLHNLFAELKRRSVYKLARTNSLLCELGLAGLNRREHSRIFRSMSSEAAKLLQQFDQLPLQEQKELSTAILKRTSKFDYEEPSDEELTAAAARVFEVLDQEEDDAAAR
jgi:hypothetical protein